MGSRQPGRYGLVFVTGPGTVTHEAIATDDQEGPEGVSQAPPGSLYAELEDLARRPGQWARVVTYHGNKSASAVASDLRAGRRPVPRGGKFTFAASMERANGESHLYAVFFRTIAATDGRPEGADQRRLPFVAAEPVARHLRLLADRGVGLRGVARESGVSRSTLSKLVYGQSSLNMTAARRVHKKTAMAILAIEGQPASGQAARVAATRST